MEPGSKRDLQAYASGKLQEMVGILVTDPREAFYRLGAIATHFSALSKEDFPESLTEDFSWVKTKLTQQPLSRDEEKEVLDRIYSLAQDMEPYSRAQPYWIP